MSGYGRRWDDRAGTASSTYNRSKIMASSPEELVVLMYERLLSDMKGAQIAIETQNLDAKAERLQSATDIVFELLSALDREQGEVSERLAALYGYMIQRLGHVSRTLNPEPLGELCGLVESLLSAWRTVADDASESPSAVPSN